jgi:mRNA interferase HigB
VRVIKPSTVKEYTRRYPDAEKPLMAWLKLAEQARWTSLQDIRQIFPNADGVIVSSGNPVVVFNIRGNKYRLIVAIHYRPSGRVFVLRFLTHAEYDKEKWKAEL